MAVSWIDSISPFYKLNEEFQNNVPIAKMAKKMVVMNTHIIPRISVVFRKCCQLSTWESYDELFSTHLLRIILESGVLSVKEYSEPNPS